MNYPGSTREQAYGAAARSRLCASSARCTSNVVVSASSTAVVSFDALDYDYGGFWDTSHQSQFVVPVSGVYRIQAAMYMLNSDSDVSFDVRRTTVGNVTTTMRRFTFTNGLAFELLEADFEFGLSTGEYIDVLVTNDDGGASRTITARTYSDPYLTLRLLQASGSGA